MENNNQETNMITLKSLLNIIKRNILLILIITIVFGVAGAFYAKKYKPTVYTAIVTAMVDNAQTVKNEEDIGSSNYSISINMVRTFKDFISSNVVAKDVVKELQEKNPDKYSNLTIAGVLSGISFARSTDTTSISLMITIKYTISNDQIAAVEIVNQVVESAVKLANTQDGANNYVYKGLANNLVVVDEIDLTNQYYRENLNTFVPGTKGELKTIIICALIGLCISAVIIVIKYLLNDTFTSKKEFENLYNITVFSTIPDIVEKK